MDIKKVLSNHKFLYALLALIKHRNEKDYLALFSEMQRVVRIESRPDCLNKAPICIFDVNDKIGLFAFLRRVTEFLYYCDNMGFAPHIQWSYSDYKDDGISNNPFEYYYQQPVELNQNEIENRALVKFAPGSLTMAREYISSDLYQPGQVFIENMGKIAKKYLILRECVQSYISDFIEDRAIDSTTLGVHIRGTDFKKAYKNHPVFVELHEYYPFINEALSKHQYKKIFLATDDNEILNSFLKHFNGIEIIYMENTVRGNGDLGVHNIANLNNEISAYREGMNALCDVYSLVACGGLISGVSHVSMFARIIKAGNGDCFSYDKTISKGIHKKGINAAKEKFNEEPNAINV